MIRDWRQFVSSCVLGNSALALHMPPAPARADGQHAGPAILMLGNSEGRASTPEPIGDGPAFRHVGRNPVYKVAELDRWIEALGRIPHR